MSAWDQLLAASSLTSGSAWDLLSHPKQGGLIVNDGVGVEVLEMVTIVEVASNEVVAEVDDNAAIEVEVGDTGVEVEVLE